MPPSDSPHLWVDRGMLGRPEIHIAPEPRLPAGRQLEGDPYAAGFDRAHAFLVAQGFDVQRQVASTSHPEFEFRATRERTVGGDGTGRRRDEVRVTWRPATSGEAIGRVGMTPSTVDIRVTCYELLPTGKWRAVDPEPLRNLAEAIKREFAS